MMGPTAAAVITDNDSRRLRTVMRKLRSSRRQAPAAGQIAAIRRRLSGARLVGPHEVPPNVVTLGSRVCLRDLDSGKAVVLTLSDPLEVPLFGDRLSVAGPCGADLLGKRVGQVVTWTTRPGGGARQRRYRIERLIYQPEAAGDPHL